MDIVDEKKPLIHNKTISDNNINLDEFIKTLPEWTTIITKAERRDDEHKTLHVKLLIAAKTVDEFRAWLEDLQEKTKTTYKIKSTDRCKGKVVSFKQRLHCHHRTHCVRLYDPALRNKTRNTNCPSSITVTLRAIRKGNRCKNKPDPALPCEINFVATHNHDLQDALAFRQVSDEVNKKLLELFKVGHTPATALEVIKNDIRANHENCDEVLRDRKYCPDYRHCHYVYAREFKTNHQPTDFVINAPEFLKERIEVFNKTHKLEAARIAFDDDANYAICVCTALMRRVHEHAGAAPRIVFVDSIATPDERRVLTLLTPSEIGGVPLGVILASSKRTSVIKLGFKLLRDMVGSAIFGGATDGPRVFVTNDSATERAALSQVWIDSTNLLGVFHVLQSVWRWLINPDSGICKDKRTQLFAEFKRVAYARSLGECTRNFEEACKSVEMYPKYCKFLEEMWERRELWALYHRNKVLNDDDNFCESAMKLIKDKIFERTRKYTMVHMLEFVCTKLVKYYERRVHDAAHNRLTKNPWGKWIKPPPEHLAEKISLLEDNVMSVPSEKIDHMFYLVYIDTLMCSCSGGAEDKFCKHVNWACVVLNTVTLDEDSCSEFYKISTGKEFEHSADASEDAIVVIPHLTLEPENEEQLIITFEDKTENVEEMVVENLCDEKMSLNADMTNACNDFFESVKSLYNESPRQVVQALDTLNATLKTQNVESFVSACATFGSAEYEQTDETMIVEEGEDADVVQILKGNTYYIIPNS